MRNIYNLVVCRAAFSSSVVLPSKLSLSVFAFFMDRMKFAPICSPQLNQRVSLHFAHYQLVLTFYLNLLQILVHVKFISTDFHFGVDYIYLIKRWVLWDALRSFRFVSSSRPSSWSWSLLWDSFSSSKGSAT